jgi:prepilin-type N-terminal cleavage/methylation domain-containing protein
MKFKSPQFLLARWFLKLSRNSLKGFTLLELLIAIAIGSAIMSTLLYLVVELAQANRREEVLTQTQQDMQRAIDYITRDAREAVYVYSTPAALTGNPTPDTPLVDRLTNLPAGTPILAFWRLDPVDTSEIGNTACTAKEAECATLKVRQSAYTLVVYLQEQNPGGSIWGGPSRIIRYELPKYSDVANLTQRKGYSDPTLCNSFENWVGPSTDCDSGNVGTTQGVSAVLTDYVDSINNASEACPSGYLRTPSTSTSFYTCVRSGALGEDPDREGTQANTNQTLLVYLRGNATDGRDGLLNTFNEEGRLPTLESEVLIRGVLNERTDL